MGYIHGGDKRVYYPEPVAEGDKPLGTQAILDELREEMLTVISAAAEYCELGRQHEAEANISRVNLNVYEKVDKFRWEGDLLLKKTSLVWDFWTIGVAEPSRQAALERYRRNVAAQAEKKARKEAELKARWATPR